MDLYRAVRIATYLVVFTGALAVWMVENHLGYLSLVAGAAVLDYTFCDAGRRPPIRRWLADLLTLAILLAYAIYLALPAYLSGRPWVAVSEVAHFLIVLQAVTFFTPQRGSIIRTYCCPTLAVLVVTAVVFTEGHGPGLLFRLALYVAATAWLLFLNALWRERQRFAEQEEALELVSGAKPNAQRPSARQHLGERTARQGLAMTAVMTVLCLVTGFLLFFSWPRLSESTMLFFRSIWPSTEETKPEPGAGMEGPRVLPASGGGVSGTFNSLKMGFSEDLRLDQLAPLYEDPAPALEVFFPDLPRDALDDDGMLYIRGAALATYRDNHFVPADGTNWRDHDAEAGRDYVALEEASGQHLRPMNESRLVEQRVHLIKQRTSCYFALAPVRRVKGVRVRMDDEGGLHPDGAGVLSNDDESADYIVWSNPVPRPDPNARAKNSDPRYLRWQESVADRQHRLDLRNLAQRIVADQPNDLAKALAIRDYLRDSGQFRYTTALDQLQRKGDDLAEFLFGNADQRQGHCGYFATAFVMLCRAADLPARVALGFARPVAGVPPGGTRDRKVTLQQLHGHAWGEVYFHGYGWVPFDATTAFSGTQGPGSATTPNDKKPGWEPVPDNPFPEQEKSLVGEGWDYFLDYDGTSQDRLYSTMGSSVREFFQGLGNLLAGVGDLGLSGAILAWMAGAGLLGLLVWTLMRGHDGRSERARHLTPRARAAVAFYNDLLSVLSKRGFVRRNGQTPEEFAETVVRRGGAAFEPVRMVTRTFERVRYGGEDVAGEELASLRAALESLREPPEGAAPGGAAPARL